MNKILIVEDDNYHAYLVTEVIRMALDNTEIRYATTVDDAATQVTWADLVITDYEFPELGFPALLPTLKKEQRHFILQSAHPGHLKTYEPDLQIGTVSKGTCFVTKMLGILSTRFNN